MNFSTLNDEQQKAVMHEDGPAVVFAGAGSGKTRVITTRIAHLIQRGVSPWSILAVTFTNKAANEMRERVLQLCPDAQGCTISTFHAVCARWLREFAGELGFSTNFSIYDDSDSSSALKTVIGSMLTNVDLSALVPEIKSFIHMAKTNGWFPGEVEKMQDSLSGLIPHGGIEIYKRYQEYLANANAMDFDDLLMNVLLMLRNNKTVREILQRRYRYVLVDEYQDTNRTQFELIKHIVGEKKNLFVVGDDDQSIYSWRGATPSNIIEFERYYPGAKRFILGENYRSTGNIVNAAGAMIANNQTRAPKAISTSNVDGDLIDFRLETDGEMEAWWVVDRIVSEQERFSLNEVAIFYRTNSQSRALEDALRNRDVPYRVFGTVRFYDRLEVKDVMAYLRLLVNPDDNVCCKRVINVPTRGIGAKAVEQIEDYAREHQLSILAACKKIVATNVPKLAKKVSGFVDVMQTLHERWKDTDLEDMVSLVCGLTGYSDYLKKKFPEQYLDKIENIHELGGAMANYCQRTPEATLSDWLQSVSLSKEEEGEFVEGVSLMTLHLAKGLEFARAYLVGVEEGLLPHRNSMDNPSLVEEERRLFYVGMTRAREKLSILCAYRRRVFNQVQMNSPSRFISEVPTKYLLNDGGFAAEGGYDDHYAGTTYEYEALAGDAAGVRQVSVGARVFHPTYGYGRVTEIESYVSGIKVVVDFDDVGRRKVSSSQLG